MLSKWTRFIQHIFPGSFFPGNVSILFAQKLELELVASLVDLV